MANLGLGVVNLGCLDLLGGWQVGWQAGDYRRDVTRKASTRSDSP